MIRLSFLKAAAFIGLVVVPGMYTTPCWGQNVFWRGRPPLLPGERYQPSIDLLPKRSPSDPPLLIIDHRGIQQQWLKEKAKARLNPCGHDADVTGFERYPGGTI